MSILFGTKEDLCADVLGEISCYEGNSVPEYFKIKHIIESVALPLTQEGLNDYKQELETILSDELSFLKLLKRLKNYIAVVEKGIPPKYHNPNFFKDSEILSKTNRDIVDRLNAVKKVSSFLEEKEEISLSDGEKELLNEGVVGEIIKDSGVDLGLTQPTEPVTPH